MGDSTIDSQLFILKDNWPGYPDPKREKPPGDGFLDKRWQNVVSPTERPGEKIQVYNKPGLGIAGYATFIYLQMGTQDANIAAVAKSVVVPDSATIWYQVTNDPDSNIKLPTDMMAICLGAVTNAYWGWFWCGGVCPETWVPALGGNYRTNGTLAAGPFLAHDLSYDNIGLDQVSAVIEHPAGFALAADA